jgi:hypothetical protein
MEILSLQASATNEAQKKQRVSVAGSSVAKGKGFRQYCQNRRYQPIAAAIKIVRADLLVVLLLPQLGI